jgi:uncharacterized protein
MKAEWPAIIDFHTHCFPDDLAPRAMGKLSAAANITPATDGTLSGLKRSMDKAGISVSVVLSIATKPEQTTNVNSWAARVQDDAIIPFGSLHPDFPGWREEIARMVELGIQGVKFHPDYQDFYVDDPRMFEIYEAMAAAGLIVLFHAGLDAAYEPPFRCTPPRLRRVLNAFPGGKFVAAHLGGFKHWDEVEEHIVGQKVFLDTSFSLGHMTAEQWARICKAHGFDRILFGTDTPWADQSSEVEQLRAQKLPDQDFKKVMRDNAAGLLGL